MTTITKGMPTMFRSLLSAAALAVVACAAPLTAARADSSIVVSPQQPYDVDLSQVSPTNPTRDVYNVFSWNLFLALSYPADPKNPGSPLPGSTIATPGARVWESYKASGDTFPTPPVTPTPWGTGPVYPPQCKVDEAGPVLTTAGEIPPVLSGTVQPMSTNTGFLVDQNGNKVYIDTLMNQNAYDYIYNNKFWDSDVQKQWANNIFFPTSGDNATKTVGPVNVKPAWKILAGKDDASKFYTRPAYIFDPASGSCQKLIVGLVGFHIAVKTKTAPEWIWATFEHKDNAPSCKPWSGVPTQTCAIDWQKKQYSFANPDCPDCAMNVLPTAATATKPVQVVRVIPIPEYVTKMNTQAAALVKGTVWENYELVDTQYPSAPELLYSNGNPLPMYLANTTLETYNQGTTPWSQTSSCIGCHFMAPTALRPYGTAFSDFDFQIHKAKSYSGAATK